jgi:predicted Co/Zn/Cd cation transporter (cation efflux family)
LKLRRFIYAVTVLALISSLIAFFDGDEVVAFGCAILAGLLIIIAMLDRLLEEVEKR